MRARAQTDASRKYGARVPRCRWLECCGDRFVKTGKTENAKGVLIAAGITALLSAACFANLSTMNIH
jgi:hypothetical protein